MNGREISDQAQAALTDSVTGNVFALSYKSMEASLETTRQLPLVPRKLSPTTVSGDAIVNNLHCLRRPVMCVNTPVGPQKVECGYFWHSPEYDFIVTIESESPLRDGGKLRETIEHYDIQIGAEPDPSAFRIPPGFRIVSGRRRH